MSCEPQQSDERRRRCGGSRRPEHEAGVRNGVRTRKADAVIIVVCFADLEQWVAEATNGSGGQPLRCHVKGEVSRARRGECVIALAVSYDWLSELEASKGGR